jgi:hypothetical protein
VLAVACALLASGIALAAVGDPKAGSPPGAVYQLPLDEGRGDAAPHDTSDGGDGSGAETPTDAGAPTSDTNSSETPAAGTPDAGGSSQTPQSEPGDPGPYYRSENNFGSSSHVPGTAGSGGVTEAVRAAGIDEGNTSTGAAIGLATAFVGAAVLAGWLAARARRNP